MKKLSGKVAIVTGASKGIGAAIAKEYAANGAAVVNYSTSKEGADKVVQEIIAKDGKAIAVQGSVAIAADVQRIFEAAKKEFGQLDILVNNAGIYKFGTLEEVTEGSNALGMIGGEMEKQIVSQTPLGRIGQPQDIAKIALFLASDDSAWVTGERIQGSGGLR